MLRANLTHRYTLIWMPRQDLEVMAWHRSGQSVALAFALSFDAVKRVPR
jgi:hypothetical protein